MTGVLVETRPAPDKAQAKPPLPSTRRARVARAWDMCWFGRFDPISVGMFRIFLGVLITFFYIALTPNWERFYAADGIASVATNPADAWTVFHWTEAFLPVRVFWGF